MNKSLLFFIYGIILGGIGGVGVMLIAFPYLFPPPQVNETVQAMVANPNAIAQTKFRSDVKGQDQVHWGKGDIKIYLNNDTVLLEFQSNFEVGPGPDFWVYLNSQSNIDTEQDFVNDDQQVVIQKLKSFKGSQVYTINRSDYDRAKSVTIWCRTFNQYIASANLPPLS